MKCNGYLALQMIIDIAGARGVISDAVCMGSPIIIIIYKKVNKQVCKKEFSTRIGSRDHSTSIKSTEIKQAGEVQDIKSQ